MERHRDPSTIGFVTLAALRDLFAAAGLAEDFYQPAILVAVKP